MWPHIFVRFLNCQAPDRNPACAKPLPQSTSLLQVLCLQRTCSSNRRFPSRHCNIHSYSTLKWTEYPGQRHSLLACCSVGRTSPDTSQMF